MAATQEFVPSLDDIVFENRNKEYGAYKLRKGYNKNMNIALAIGVFVVFMGVMIPFVMAKVADYGDKKQMVDVVMEATKLDKPLDEIAPPPPPPPPEEQTVQQVKFTAPVVVDSVMDTKNDLGTMEENKAIAVDETPVIQVQQEEQVVVVEEAPKEIFFIVEEQAEFPDGNEALSKFIAENVKYPNVARENDIKGKVFVRFCINYKGEIDQVSIARGVDPALDEEAMRVVKSMPKWKPAKQRGKSVNVWFTLPINFTLQ